MKLFKLPTELHYTVIRLKGNTPKQWHDKQTIKPQVMFSGSFVHWDAEAGYHVIGTIYENGVRVENDGVGYGMGTTIDGRLGFGLPWAGWHEYFTGFTGSVVSGQYIAPDWQDDAFDTQPNRIAFAVTKDYEPCVLMQDSGTTLQEFSKMAIAKGIKSMSNHDGGASRTLYLEGVWHDSSDRDWLYNAVVGYAPEDWAKLSNEDEESEEVQNMKTVCIDPGHGKQTPGKCAPDNSYYEHEFNLDVGFKLKAHLERNGIKVIMTREDENEIVLNADGSANTNASLYKRCEIANDANADYFISIHTNAANNDGWSEAEGVSVIIYGKGGEAEKLAAKIRSILPPMLDTKDRGTFVSNLAVVRETKMPAVIVEHGFHTDKSEVEKLKTQEHRKLCAEGDARAIVEYLGMEWVPEPTPEPGINWYAEAQAWAIEMGISDGTRPEEAATRAEVWQMLMNYQNIKK